MTTTEFVARPADQWHAFWHGEIGEWILTRGLSIVLLLIGAVLTARFISWTANRISSRIDANFQESDALVRSESAKHRQAVASVISYLAIALLAVMVVVQVTDILAIPVSSLVAPAAVLGAALGFHWALDKNTGASDYGVDDGFHLAARSGIILFRTYDFQMSLEGSYLVTWNDDVDRAWMLSLGLRP